MGYDPMKKGPKTRKPKTIEELSKGMAFGGLSGRKIEPASPVELAVEAFHSRVRDQDLLELEMLKAKIARERKEFPSRFLVPNVAQMRLLRYLRKRPFPKDLIFMGGNGAGKTVNGTKITAGLIWGPDIMVGPGIHADYDGEELGFEAWSVYRDRAKAEDRPIFGRLVANADSLRGAGGALMQRITRYYPRGLWEEKKMGKSFPAEIWCWEDQERAARGLKEECLCILEVKTHDQPADQGAGPDIDFIWFDEPPPPDVYEEAIGRGRANPDSIRIFTLTPLELAGWLVDELVTNADGKNVAVVYGSLWDNCRDWNPDPAMWSGGEVGSGRVLSRGNLEKVALDDMIDKWTRRSPLTMQARVYGLATHTAGSVYPYFAPAIHCPDGLRPPEGWEDWPIWNVIDPHHKRPPAVGWFLQGPNNRFYGLGEYPFEDYTKIEERKVLQYYADEIQEMEKRAGIEGRVIHRFGDPNSLRFTYSSKSGNTDDSLTIQDLYANSGLFFELSDDNMQVGHEALNELLFYNTDKEIDDETNCPPLRFCGNIFNGWAPQLNFQNGLARYRIKPKAVESNHSPANLRTIVEETWKDFPDVARYFARTVRDYAFQPLSKQKSMYDQIQESRLRTRLVAKARR